MTFNLEQAKALLEMFGGEEAEITVVSHKDGLMAYHTEYPEEGSVFLGGVPVANKEGQDD